MGKKKKPKDQAAAPAGRKGPLRQEKERPKNQAVKPAGREEPIHPEIKKDIHRTLLSRPFRRIGSAVPESIAGLFETKLRHAGIQDDTEVWLGIRILFAFILGGVMLFAFLAFMNPTPTLENALLVAGVFIGSFLLAAVVFYLGLYFAISDRSSKLEKALPDFLLLTVSNLRAGMTPFSSFVRAAQPEFGALHEEVLMSAARASGAASLSDAFMDMAKHFDSKIFRRTVTLFTKGMRSGGQLAKLLRSSADEVQHIQDLRAELATSTKTYAMFLGFITIIIMPFLLSISTLFVSIFLELQPEYGQSGSVDAGIPTFSGNISITPDEMMLISIFTLVLTSLLVSSLAGIIQKGRALYGVKYFPPFAIASVIMFFIAHSVLGQMLMGFKI